MAQHRQFFIVGHILLDVGLLGYISGNTTLAYIGLIGALPFFLREFVIAKEGKKEDTDSTNYSLGGKPMSKDNKILLAAIVVSFVLLAGLQLYLNRQAIGVSIGAAQAVKKSVEKTPSPTPVATETASPSATVKGKVTPTVKATVKPTVEAEPSVEATPAE